MTFEFCDIFVPDAEREMAPGESFDVGRIGTPCSAPRSVTATHVATYTHVAREHLREGEDLLRPWLVCEDPM
jgi:hypothetical protein